jgi:hypothetical protein
MTLAAIPETQCFRRNWEQDDGVSSDSRCKIPHARENNLERPVRDEML